MYKLIEYNAVCKVFRQQPAIMLPPEMILKGLVEDLDFYYSQSLGDVLIGLRDTLKQDAEVLQAMQSLGHLFGNSPNRIATTDEPLEHEPLEHDADVLRAIQLLEQLHCKSPNLLASAAAIYNSYIADESIEQVSTKCAHLVDTMKGNAAALDTIIKYCEPRKLYLVQLGDAHWILHSCSDECAEVMCQLSDKASTSIKWMKSVLSFKDVDYNQQS